MKTSPVPILSEKLTFPDPLLSGDEGLTAIGGDLSPDRLLLGYRMGIFPWTADPISWWSPNPRAIIPLEHFHISRRLRRLLKKSDFQITINKAFIKTIRACAESPRKDASTWIAPEFIKAYSQLHRLGHAHSFECRIDGELAGGIYGVAIGGFFAGESMFHHSPNAGNIALACLLQHLRERKFRLFDVQMATPHTQKFGAIEIPRQQYLRKLADALKPLRSFI